MVVSPFRKNARILRRTSLHESYTGPSAAEWTLACESACSFLRGLDPRRLTRRVAESESGSEAAGERARFRAREGADMAERLQRRQTQDSTTAQPEGNTGHVQLSNLLCPLLLVWLCASLSRSSSAVACVA